MQPFKQRSYSRISTDPSLVYMPIEDSSQISAVRLEIKATHAGKVNGNYIFYTPRSMRTGVVTLVNPFKKHLQKLHNGEAIGVITGAQYEEYSNLPEDFQLLVNKLNQAATKEELVSSVKELTKHPTFKSKDYRGVGYLKVEAELYDSKTINNLRKGDKGTVSIGGKSSSAYCSVCGTSDRPCNSHTPGETYRDELCFHIYDNMLLDHIGFVPNPADNDTYSAIIEDSFNDNDILIKEYIIKDSQGIPMNKLTLDMLKEKAMDIPSLISTYFTDTAQQEIAQKLYDNSLKNSRASAYVFGPEKILNTKSIVGAYLAGKLAEELENETDKQVIASQVKTTLDKLLAEGETLEDGLTRLLVLPQEPEAIEPETVEPTAVDTPIVAAEPEAVVEPELVAEPVIIQDNVGITADALELISTKITDTIVSRIEALLDSKNEVKIADQKELLFQQLDSLRSEVESSDELVRQLTSDYASSIIQQILILKNKLNDNDYKSRLSKRSIDVLKANLEDALEETNIESSQSQTEQQPLQTATIEDSLNTKIDPQTVEPPATIVKTFDIKDELQVRDWFTAKTKEKGLSAAVAEFNKLKNTKN